MSTRKFMLDTRGYRAIVALDGQAALAMIPGELVRVAVIDLDLMGMTALELVEAIRVMGPEIRTILTSRTLKTVDFTHGSETFLGSDYAPMDLLEKVRVMAQRKHGPKKAALVRMEMVG